MFKLLLLIVCTTVVTAGVYLTLNGFSSLPFGHTAMISSQVSIKLATLMAREELLPPIGSNKKQDYPTKSAAVFVELENLQQSDVKVIVQKIEIRNQASDRLELVDQNPQEITLRSLQSLVHDFHLTQPGTYEKPGQVKAIVTLKINGQTQVVESNVIEVEPY